jgi:hypothetical protein
MLYMNLEKHIEVRLPGRNQSANAMFSLRITALFFEIMGHFSIFCSAILLPIINLQILLYCFGH